MKKILAVGLCACFISGVASAVTIDWVTVGNPGNVGEQSRLGDYGDTTYYGSVSEVYKISTYEVTAGQYTEFLNAVAATTDTYGLYSNAMGSSSYGCMIQRSGSSGSYTYSVASDRANRPVNYVSWYDSLRFTNWLHNGQPTGVQDAATTEDGAYDMSLGSSVVRKSGAQVWLPSENEWYKAAYHKNDGVTGNYFDYPTSSDSIPSNDLINPDPGNNATYMIYISGSPFDYTIGSPYYRTEVGAHENSDSPYGTFDQGGNVWEWNETLIGSDPRISGGSHSYSDYGMGSSFQRSYYPEYEGHFIGFRVASVPEPCSLVLLGLGGLALRYRKR